MKNANKIGLIPHSHSMNQHGQHSEDTQRKQEELEGKTTGQRIWLAEACAASGKASGGQGSDSKASTTRIIKLENSYQVKEPIYLQANTTQEIETYLCSTYPIDCSAIGMRFSTSLEGTLHRKYIEGAIDPSKDTVYVKLYLKKHPHLSK